MHLGPRFALLFFWYFLTARPNSFLPKFTLIVGLIRTILCGGWVYVTSTDDHQWHDIFMISYLLLTLPWMLGCLASSPNNARAIKYRKYLAGAFFGTLVPLIYFFIQHKVHKVPGGESILNRHACYMLTEAQHIPSMPFSNGLLFSLMLDLMLSRLWISQGSI